MSKLSLTSQVIHDPKQQQQQNQACCVLNLKISV
jgi:hypothetical protein